MSDALDAQQLARERSLGWGGFPRTGRHGPMILAEAPALLTRVGDCIYFFDAAKRMIGWDTSAPYLCAAKRLYFYPIVGGGTDR